MYACVYASVYALPRVSEKESVKRENRVKRNRSGSCAILSGSRYYSYIVHICVYVHFTRMYRSICVREYIRTNYRKLEASPTAGRVSGCPLCIQDSFVNDLSAGVVGGFLRVTYLPRTPSR